MPIMDLGMLKAKALSVLSARGRVTQAFYIL